MRIAVYPGSFDPITLGHLDIIRRAAKMFDRLNVVIMNNADKKCFFTVDERLEFIKASVCDIENVTVEYSDGLIVDYMRSVGASTAVRGLRAMTDFEYELQWATFNQKLDSDFEAVFMMAKSDHNFLSSSIVREIGRFGGDISKMVSPEIHDVIKNKLMLK